MHKQLFDFLDKNFTFYPSWGNPDGRGNPDGWGNPDDRGNPDGFFANFNRPDYINTPVYWDRLSWGVKSWSRIFAKKQIQQK